LKNEKVSEFIKDLLPRRNDDKAIYNLLRHWCGKLGRNFSEIENLYFGTEDAASSQEEPGRDSSIEVQHQTDVITTMHDLPSNNIESEHSILVTGQDSARSMRSRSTRSIWKKRDDNSRKPSSSSEERFEVEQKALDAVEKWLVQNGYKVFNVAAYDVGCDLWGEHPDGHRIWVEVKGRSGLYPIQLTVKQWKRAQEKQDRYWLFIAVIDGQNVKSIYLIKNPTQINFERKETKMIEYEATPEIWTEHGKKLFG